jgi:hypothetical protein
MRTGYVSVKNGRQVLVQVETRSLEFKLKLVFLLVSDSLKLNSKLRAPIHQ